MQPIRAPQKTFPQPCPTNLRRVFSIVPVQKFPGVSHSPSLTVLVLENKRRLTCSIYCVCVFLEGARAAGRAIAVIETKGFQAVAVGLCGGF